MSESESGTLDIISGSGLVASGGMSSSSSNASLNKGVVKWFNDAKGFGFIEHTSGRDVFVHYSVIDADGFKTLKDGEAVEYEMKEGPKGLHAVKVIRDKTKIEVLATTGDAAAASDASSSDDSEDGSEEAH